MTCEVVIGTPGPAMHRLDVPMLLKLGLRSEEVVSYLNDLSHRRCEKFHGRKRLQRHSPIQHQRLPAIAQN